jgi:hypothetical protein
VLEKQRTITAGLLYQAISWVLKHIEIMSGFSIRMSSNRCAKLPFAMRKGTDLSVPKEGLAGTGPLGPEGHGLIG